MTMSYGENMKGGSSSCSKSVTLPINLRKIQVVFPANEDWIYLIRFIDIDGAIIQIGKQNSNIMIGRT